VSAELLIKLDQNTEKSTISGGSSAKLNNPKEKKEGNSLFDSLMNEAKNTSDSKEKTTEKKEVKDTSSSQKNDIIKKDGQDSSKEKGVLKNEEKTDFNSEIKNNAKKVTSTESQTSSQILTNSNITDKIEVTNEKKNTSLKKLVEKLVDIVVNAAKDIFDKKTGKVINSGDLKNRIEKIVDNKINSMENKGNLKDLIIHKLDIVNSSVEIIKKEVKDIPAKKNAEIKISKDIIEDEVKIIKDSVQGIKKDIKEEKSEIKGIKEDKSEIKDTKEDKSEIKDIKEEKSEIKDISTAKSENKKNSDNVKIIEIDKSLSIIDTSANEIENLLAKISVTDKEVSTDKKELKIVEKKVEYKIEIIKEVIADIKVKVSEIVIVNTSKKEDLKPSLLIVNKDDEAVVKSNKPLLATMFLNAQKTAKDKNSLEQIKDAKANIMGKKTIESVKVSAEKLDLKLETTEVKHEEEKGVKPILKEKVEEIKTNTLINNKSLNKVLKKQKIEANNIIKEQSIISSKNLDTKNIEQEKRNLESVEIIVPKEIVPSLQNKIIGAQQKMGSFMNDVARNMYLNYKPPVTALRVNLNPANLGSISIILKANKIDNSLSVSMNLSNSNTSSNVSIDFNMQDQSSGNEFNQHLKDDNKKDDKNTNKNDDLESDNIEENELIVNNDYM